jgi:hypothetical protein
LSHHRKVVEAIRALDPKEHKAITKWASVLSDDDVIRHMFQNVRIDGDTVRSGRLSRSGSNLLKKLYTFWEVKLNHPMTSRQQLRFGRACRLPYYYTDQYLLCFEADVGMWLTLIQGDIDLMDNVLPEY